MTPAVGASPVAAVTLPGGAGGLGARRNPDARQRRLACRISQRVPVRCHRRTVRSLHMEQLPYIDDHVCVITASPDRTWRALVAVLAGTFRELPRPLVSVWGLEQSAQCGDWDHPAPGDTITGFAVVEVDPPRVLVLRGRHRFSRYELRFTLDESAERDRVELHARSSAEFPGLLGRVYQALVIRSSGHVLAVRRLLTQIARQAERVT